jgi:hypothetical protein
MELQADLNSLGPKLESKFAGLDIHELTADSAEGFWRAASTTAKAALASSISAIRISPRSLSVRGVGPAITEAYDCTTVGSMSVAIACIVAAAAVLSAGAAWGSWRSAKSANSTANQLAQIEIDRRHAELTPQFNLTATRVSGDFVRVDIKLVGPFALQWIDELTVSVRNDSTDHRSNLAGGPTDEDIAKVVWGPLRFLPNADGATKDGRSVAPVPLEVGNDRPFWMEPTQPPPWSDPNSQWWQSLYGGQGIRLMLHCESAKFGVWDLPLEIAITGLEPTTRIPPLTLTTPPK